MSPGVKIGGMSVRKPKSPDPQRRRTAVSRRGLHLTSDSAPAANVNKVNHVRKDGTGRNAHSQTVRNRGVARGAGNGNSRSISTRNAHRLSVSNLHPQQQIKPSAIPENNGKNKKSTARTVRKSRTMSGTERKYLQLRDNRTAGMAFGAETGTQKIRQSAKKRQNVRERFGKDWDVVLQGTKKTRKIPVRILAVIFTCLIAVIILANPVRDFLAQQEEKRAITSQLAESKAELAALQQQVDLWNDPSYVQAQARKRLGFVLPGQTLYYVSGDLTAADKAKKADEEERAIALRRKAMPFYVGIWKSIEIAGTADLDPEKLSNPENTPLVNEPVRDDTDKGAENGQAPAANQRNSKNADSN
ncbi:septum formation initiator family protein [Arcanobacterium hippocoleae]